MATSGDLIAAVGGGLCGFPAPRRDPAVNLDLIVGLAGSGRAAARYLGVAESTLRGWRHGVKPRRDPAFFQSAARILATHKAGTWDPAYRGDTELRIRGIVVVSKEHRTRTVYVGRFIPRQVMQGILRSWRKGEDNRAERLLYSAIDRYYQPLGFDVIEKAWFE